ncbi:MAG: prolipoprotein diacylglyceryl transferase family protein, partial [Vicinamibacterales bacterium]
MTRETVRCGIAQTLDAVARTEIRIGRWGAPAFHFCGVTGLLVAIVQSAVLVLRLGLSPLVLVGVTAIAVATFFVVIIVTKIVTGEEVIIYYHHELAVLAATSSFVWSTGQPVFPYLSITLLGIGLFLAFGRVGCFLVGCCHGRPSRWGVRYRSEHAAAGFPSCYVGVRLIPVQLIEAALVFTTVMAGSVQLFLGQSPGWILTWYTILYGWGRFCLEFLRGDGDRPYYLGFSQAQWISAVLIGSLPWIASHGALPSAAWQMWAAAALPSTMLVIGILRLVRRSSLHTLLDAVHVQEICAALREVVHEWRPPVISTDVARTSLGVQLSGGVLRRPGWRFFHYAI